MSTLETKLIRTLNERLRNAGLDPNELINAFEIVVFGSRALGVNRRSSDIDVLVVADTGRTGKRHNLDLIFVSRADCESKSWLASELATHISKYGVWIRGDGNWRRGASLGNAAVDRKERRILSLTQGVTQAWSDLHPFFQAKYRTTIRREMQRLNLLRASIPVPPTPLLDLEWRRHGITHCDLISLCESIGLLPSSEAFIKNMLAAS